MGKSVNFPGGSVLKNLPFQCRRCRFHPWAGKVPWRRKWKPTPVFLPGESPWAEELDGLQFMRSQRVRHDWTTKHRPVHSASKLNNNYVPFKELDSLKFDLNANQDNIWKTWWRSQQSYIPERYHLTFIVRNIAVSNQTHEEEKLNRQFSLN